MTVIKMWLSIKLEGVIYRLESINYRSKLISWSKWAANYKPGRVIFINNASSVVVKKICLRDESVFTGRSWNYKLRSINYQLTQRISIFWFLLYCKVKYVLNKTLKVFFLKAYNTIKNFFIVSLQLTCVLF